MEKTCHTCNFYCNGCEIKRRDFGRYCVEYKSKDFEITDNGLCYGCQKPMDLVSNEKRYFTITYCYKCDGCNSEKEVIIFRETKKPLKILWKRKK